MRKAILAVLALAVLCMPAFAGMKTGEDVLKAMHDKYHGKWYKTLTFVQKNTQWTLEGGIKNSTWYEALSLPGKLRIDFDPVDSGDGILFADGKQMSFKNDKLDRSDPRTHDLLVLGFDVYGQPIEKTIAQLKGEKYDLSIVSENEWEGRPVWVVGAKAGDEKSPQFWIDKKRLYFVKLFKPAGPKGQLTQEIRFNKYSQVKGGGWVAKEVLFLVDGNKVFKEEYSQVRTGMKLSDDLFDPEKWAEVDKDYYKN